MISTHSWAELQEGHKFDHGHRILINPMSKLRLIANMHLNIVININPIQCLTLSHLEGTQPSFRWLTKTSVDITENEPLELKLWKSALERRPESWAEVNNCHMVQWISAGGKIWQKVWPFNFQQNINTRKHIMQKYIFTSVITEFNTLCVLEQEGAFRVLPTYNNNYVLNFITITALMPPSILHVGMDMEQFICKRATQR